MRYQSVLPEALEIIEEAYEAIGDSLSEREEFEKETRLPCLEAAERLKKPGVVHARDDVFFITKDELMAVRIWTAGAVVVTSEELIQRTNYG